MDKLKKVEEFEPLEIDVGNITPETIDNLMRRDAKIYGMLIRKNKEIKELKRRLNHFLNKENRKCL